MHIYIDRSLTTTSKSLKCRPWGEILCIGIDVSLLSLIILPLH